MKTLPKRKYWYRTEKYVCVDCGKEETYRERVYDEVLKGTKWIDDLCWTHQL
jgi:hypothetical protein